MTTKVLLAIIIIQILTSCATTKVAKARMYWVIKTQDNAPNKFEEKITPVTAEYLHELPKVQLFDNKDIINNAKRRDLKLVSVKAYRAENYESSNLPAIKHEKKGNLLKVRIPFDINSSSSIIADFNLVSGAIENDTIINKPSLILGLTEFGEKCECRSIIEFEFIFKTATWNADDFEYYVQLNNEIIE